MDKYYTGGCLCGAVQFDIRGEFEQFFLCHCKYCQKDTGSAHGANLFSSTARLRWLKGEENLSRFTLPGTRHSRCFCKTCGSALPSMQMEGALLVVTAGSLEENIQLKPNGHLFCASRASWDSDLHTFKEFEEFPE